MSWELFRDLVNEVSKPKPDEEEILGYFNGGDWDKNGFLSKDEFFALYEMAA